MLSHTAEQKMLAFKKFVQNLLESGDATYQEILLAATKQKFELKETEIKQALQELMNCSVITRSVLITEVKPGGDTQINTYHLNSGKSLLSLDSLEAPRVLLGFIDRLQLN